MARGRQPLAVSAWESYFHSDITSRLRKLPSLAGVSEVFRTIDVHACNGNSQVSASITSRNIMGETLLSKAAESGSVELFEVVQKRAWEILTPDQVWGEGVGVALDPLFQAGLSRSVSAG